MSDENASVSDWSAVLVLIMFLLSNLAVVAPFRLPIPHMITAVGIHSMVAIRAIPLPSDTPHFRKLYLRLNFITVPLLSVIILWTSGAIDRIVIRKGIVGADGIQTLDILALFLSLAYLSISLDATGLLRYLALWVARKGGSSGPKLYFYLYVFFLACGVVVGNDPVILSGTAFLAYFTRVSGITPPTAWIFAQFAAANTASVVLVSSNPTNLVLSGAFSLSFTAYTAHVILPFLGAGIAVYPVLIFGLFRSSEFIPPSITLNLDGEEGSRAALVDRTGALFGSALLLVTLGVLVGTSTVGVPVWEVTVPPARHQQHPTRVESSLCEPRTQSTYPPRQMTHEPPARRTLLHLVAKYAARISSIFPTVSTVLQRLPLPLIPFALLMFILVQSLSTKGWVEVLSIWWGAWVDRTGILGAVGGMGLVSCIFCNICGTNIGATILLARVLQLWIASRPSMDVRAREGAIYALALGSNYGAFSMSFSASLAGLLWRQILRQKGIHVRSRQFFMLNLPIIVTAMLVSTSVLVAQVYIPHPHP